MVKSMTGFGRAEGKLNRGVLRIELKSFNHRFFEFSGKIPAELAIYEEEIKRFLKKKIRRGSINITFTYARKTNNSGSVTIDGKLARHYFNLARELKRKLGLKEDLAVKDMLAFPGVVVYEENQEALSQDWPACRRILEKAVTNLAHTKEREGQDLLKDLLSHLGSLEHSLKAVRRRAERIVREYKKGLRKKLFAILGTEPTRERLEEEATLFVRNVNISEEISRIESHLNNFRYLLKNEEEVGRKLDFVAQELYREVNTVGAKGNDYLISKEVVEMKSEIEKIREQVQNVE
jgi:uncharacterized protein (TIGR00255 family)